MRSRPLLVPLVLALGLQAGFSQAQPRPKEEPAARHQPQHGPGAKAQHHKHTPPHAQANQHGKPGPGPGADRGRGAGPDHRFHRGDRLPTAYRGRQYVVDDWRAHRLSAPPPGHRWVQVGADYVLVAVATGIIVQLLLAP